MIESGEKKRGTKNSGGTLACNWLTGQQEVRFEARDWYTGNQEVGLIGVL